MFSHCIYVIQNYNSMSTYVQLFTFLLKHIILPVVTMYTLFIKNNFKKILHISLNISKKLLNIKNPFPSGTVIKMLLSYFLLSLQLILQKHSKLKRLEHNYIRVSVFINVEFGYFPNYSDVWQEFDGREYDYVVLRL